MAISGQQAILVGLPNQVQGSDSLYTAFNKINQNFSTLFSNASPALVAGNGIQLTVNPINGTVNVINQGVRQIIAGTNITLSDANGVVTISSTGSSGNVGLTSVGLNSSTLTVTGSPLVTNGNLTVNLPTSGVSPGTYPLAQITVDQYGRVTNAVPGSGTGTVTSVNVTAGAGIAVAGGPITTAGNIQVTNTGVTSLTAGTGINLTANTGAITISSTATGTVTSVGITSSTLNITGTTITSTGSFGINLPNNITISGNINANNIGNISGINLDSNASNILFGNGVFAALGNVAKWVTAPATNTSAGTAGQAAYDNGGNLYVCVATNTWTKFNGNLSW
jgi:hypothetical protein